MTKDKALGIAISQFLSDWNNDPTNEQILGAVFDEDFDNVTFWEPFESEDGEYLAGLIEDLAVTIFNASEAV
jgi:hypothetical protein